MCGIAGLFSKSLEVSDRLGSHLGDMLLQLSDRGPDSAGVAFYRDPAAFPPPHSEPWPALRARIERGLRDLARADEASPWLVVSHAGAIRLAIAVACGWSLPTLFALRLDYGTRVRLRVGIDADDRLWGELLEVRPI